MLRLFHTAQPVSTCRIAFVPHLQESIAAALRADATMHNASYNIARTFALMKEAKYFAVSGAAKDGKLGVLTAALCSDTCKQDSNNVLHCS